MEVWSSLFAFIVSAWAGGFAFAVIWHFFAITVSTRFIEPFLGGDP